MASSLRRYIVVESKNFFELLDFFFKSGRTETVDALNPLENSTELGTHFLQSYTKRINRNRKVYCAAIDTALCNADTLKTRLGPKKRNSPSVRQLIGESTMLISTSGKVARQVAPPSA